MQAWLRKRRRGVGQAIQNVENLDWDLEGVEQSAEWSKWHEAEKQFQKDKQMKLRLEAIEFGTLDLPDDLRDEFRTRKEADALNDKKLIADRKRRERASQKTKLTLDWEAWSGMSFWVESQTPEVDRKLAEHNLTVTTDRWLADVFVVQDAAEPPERVRWIGSLLGKVIVDLSAIQGKGGLLLHFKPARKNKMKLHITKDFKNSHGAIFNLINRALALPN